VNRDANINNAKSERIRTSGLSVPTARLRHHIQSLQLAIGSILRPVGSC